MADIEFDESMAGDVAVRGFGISRIINGVGALVSLALIAGLGWWGYQLLMRDVTGVPVIRALQGPMRIAPDDPGGDNAAYQGLAVNNIPAEGAAEPPADRLVLSPGPVPLAPEDRPEGALEAAARPLARPGPLATDGTGETPQQMAGTAAAPEGAAAQEAAAAVAGEAETQGGGAVVPGSARVADAPAGQPESAPAQDRSSVIEATLKQLTQQEGPARPDVIPVSVRGVSKSLIPMARPARAPAAKTPEQASAAPAVNDGAATDGAARQTAGIAGSVSEGDPAAASPAAFPPGTPLAQIGAFKSQQIALDEWGKAEARFGAFMAGKTRVIERAEAGGSVFYRLRVHGFDSLSDARRFCAVLTGQNANCIPVVTR